MNYSLYYSSLLTSVIGMALLLYLFRVLALKIGLVDVPNARKIHQAKIPMAGGLALFCMSAFNLLLIPNTNVFLLYLVVTSGFVVAIGVLDDLYNLSAAWRFMVQISASLVLIFTTDIQISSFGFLLIPGWEMNLRFLSVPITVFGVVGVINAINMADGVDSLAASTFLLPIVYLAFATGLDVLTVWLLLLASCTLVFIGFNKTVKFKVFLGDNGSLLLGFLLAWMLVYFSQGEAAIIRPVTALYLVALPIFDTIFVMMRRILKGASPFKPDKTHLHHLFLALGCTQTKTLLAMLFLHALLIGLGVLFLYLKLQDYYQFYVFVSLSAVYYLILRRVWSGIK